MTRDAVLVAAAAASVSATLALGLRALFAARWRSLAAHARARRAQRGEREAEALLRREGWAVVARQVGGTLRYRVDGEPARAEVRADLVVERAGRRCVAEVKTGASAPRLETAATRRQLLEYQAAFDVDGVLLVEPEQGRVHDVDLPRAPARTPPGPVLLALALGLLAGALATLAVLAQWPR